MTTGNKVCLRQSEPPDPSLERYLEQYLERYLDLCDGREIVSIAGGIMSSDGALVGAFF